ncbi:lycopene cyclase domain-containing protein [Antricoccus suffuscus]|uniref:Lycopene cyclase domain-containing protein n=1 Tax=Antricoccus suffuscus TaxID=1629062 RepID=A0A2T0ZZ71_9ACTN|nr:lycopene cyclase domain-containing protein [Antricoccus suffuscus]PRZ41388.1 lycopene cyclase domain-containing protein [Antricoccus suffuscus]
MIYTVGSVVAILVALTVDRWLTRERLVATRVFWIAYAIIFAFQLLMNGLLTGIPVVTYDESVIWGPRLAFAPIEDLGFGFGLVLLVLTTWSRLGRVDR